MLASVRRDSGCIAYGPLVVITALGSRVGSWMVMSGPLGQFWRCRSESGPHAFIGLPCFSHTAWDAYMRYFPFSHLNAPLYPPSLGSLVR